MNEYDVKVFADGQLLDEVRVQAADDWKAQMPALLRVIDSVPTGALVTYEVQAV